MSYIFVTESFNLSDKVTNHFKKEFKKVNAEISKSKSPQKKLKAETASPEEMFDVESFHKDIEETTTTGGVGGSYQAPLFTSPIKKSSLFAPEGSPEHKEGSKILKQMEKPIGKVFSKKDLKETFLGEEEIEETTTTGSVGGSYVSPKIWAKNKSEWRGTKKLYPGGKFVKPKEKCKEFPYCDESPDAIELSDYPKDKLSPVFEDKKGMYDMYDEEIYHLRDSDYLRLIEIIESVNNLKQFPSVKKLWELYQQKFDGYVSKYLKERTDKIIKEKYNELTRGQKVADEMVGVLESKKIKPVHRKIAD